MTSIYDPRRHVGIEPERVTHVSSTDYPGHYPNEDHSWNLSTFKKSLQVKVQRLSQRSIEFDLIGVDASIANAIRRILIAEVPTICVENVYVFDNTSVVVDEVLVHRIGLVPLNIDPDKMQMRPSPTDATDRNTIVFHLNVSCTRRKNPSVPKGTTDPELLYDHSTVFSSDLTWKPQGEQSVVFASNPPRATNPNIVLTKLRPGQRIEMEMHAVKGVGKDHAKFSPVATASYRILPLIVLKKEHPVPKHLADKFAACFSPGVIKVHPKTKEVTVDEKMMRNDTVSRGVLRYPEFKDCVELKRVRDFFIFHVESESAYAPQRLPIEAIKVMREKIALIKRGAESLQAECTT